ncbi:MAG TPA: hypothetical protein VGA73_16950, partial [Candidatus Binatia bacterium]
DIVNAYVNKLTISREKGNVYQLYAENRGFVFQFCPDQAKCDPKSRRHATIASLEPEEAGDTKPKFFIRSPEAVLFFLGELMRSEIQGDTPPQMLDTAGPAKIPLFVVKKSALPPRDAALSVEYDGAWYYIPDGAEGGRSMHVLSLVNQILSLHKARQELPTTSAVTVVGR